MSLASPFRVNTGWVAFLLSGATLACGDVNPLGPPTVTGVYALRRVESDALPTVLYSNDLVRVRVLADTLRCPPWAPAACWCARTTVPST
ncbi:MAG: hypothetical protein ACJ79A_08265 [Gemmatimonadaceae bacterium]